MSSCVHTAARGMWTAGASLWCVQALRLDRPPTAALLLRRALQCGDHLHLGVVQSVGVHASVHTRGLAATHHRPDVQCIKRAVDCLAFSCTTGLISWVNALKCMGAFWAGTSLCLSFLSGWVLMGNCTHVRQCRWAAIQLRRLSGRGGSCWWQDLPGLCQCVQHVVQRATCLHCPFVPHHTVTATLHI